MNKATNTKISMMCAFFIAIAPILNTYASPIGLISIGEILLFITASICLILPSHAENKEKNNSYIIFVIYSIVITFLMSLSIQEFVKIDDLLKEIMAFMLYSILLIWFSRKIDIITMLQIYSNIAVVCASFLIVQFLIHFITGHWIPGLIPGFLTKDAVDSSLVISHMGRAASFFREPAHFVQYLAIPTVWESFQDKVNNKTRLFILLLSLGLSFSGNAVLVIAFLVFRQEMTWLLSRKLKRCILSIVFPIIGILLFYYIYLQSPSLQLLVARFTEGEIFGYSARKSGYIRVIRGYEIFAEFDYINIIFGLGIGNYISYIESNYMTKHMIVTSKLLGYLNGIQYYLISTGIIGFGLYLKSILKGFLDLSSFQKDIIVLFLGLSAIASFSKGCVWLLYMLLIFGTVNEPKKENHDGE